MPITFTDETLITFARNMKYREQNEGETSEEYREVIADLHQDRDPVEAHEIRTGKGWDKWTDADLDVLVIKSPETLDTNPMVMMRMMYRNHEEA